MKYTRVRVVTCALTASVVLFGSAAQINASSVSFDSPAAGVGLVLEEGSSLTSVQEEARQSERAAEVVSQVQETPEVTSADIESGVTGVGESVIDVNVVSQVQEQQMEAAINNGVGVASVLSSSAGSEDGAPAAQEVILAVGEEAAVGVLAAEAQTAQDKLIVEPVDLKETQAVKAETANAQQEEAVQSDTNTQETVQAAAANDSDASREKDSRTDEPASNTDDSRTKESDAETSRGNASETKESDAEASGNSNSETKQNADGGEASNEKDSHENASHESASQGNASQENGTEADASRNEEASTEDASQESGATESDAAEDASQAGEAADSSAAEESTSVESSSVESTAQTEAAVPESTASQSTSSATGSAVADYAVQFVGNPYVYGGTSLTNGADCSGFVMSVYENFGVSLPHSSTADRSVGVDVGGLENAQPGDIVCYSGHVGIYIGNNQIVHASTASTGIKISDADYRTPLSVRRVVN